MSPIVTAYQIGAGKEMTKQLAIEFSRIIREWLTAEQMAEVIRKNRESEYSGCCATHDYCDANMAMDEAMRNLSVDVPIDLTDDADRDFTLWNAAWDEAKAHDFYTTSDS